MAADFLIQRIPAPNTPMLVERSPIINTIWWRFLSALWKRCGEDGNNDIVFSKGAMPTNSTRGFLIIPTCAGVPTGVPEQLYDGQTAMVYDKTGNKLYVNDGSGWVAV